MQHCETRVVQDGTSSDYGAAAPRSGGAFDTKLKVKDLIDGGLLTPGANVLSLTWKDTEWHGDLLPDGNISVDGSTYTTLSGFALAMIHRVYPEAKSRSGWRVVMYQGRCATPRTRCQRSRGACGARRAVYSSALGTSCFIFAAQPLAATHVFLRARPCKLLRRATVLPVSAPSSAPGSVGGLRCPLFDCRALEDWRAELCAQREAAAMDTGDDSAEAGAGSTAADVDAAAERVQVRNKLYSAMPCTKCRCVLVCACAWWVHMWLSPLSACMRRARGQDPENDWV
jgi:hypothetical protein